MKYLLLSIALIFSVHVYSQTCNPAGNLVIFSNYDGGPLTINVDVNIPNLFIGIAAYEFCRVTIQGPFAGNVAGVWYAGYNASNNHCNLAPPHATTISGVNQAITQIEFLPTANYQAPGLDPWIIYCYQCSSTPSSGNSPEQLIAYFSQMGPSELRFHQTQYGCWSGIYNISAGGNCCLNFNQDIEGCTNPAACNYNPAATLDDGSCELPATGCTDPFACNYDALALADNGYCHYFCYGCTDETACNFDPDATINDGECDFSCFGCTYPGAANYNPLATRDDGSCMFGDCPADISGDGLVNTQDLLMFLAVFGTECPE
jgi:hypothetical protein